MKEDINDEESFDLMNKFRENIQLRNMEAQDALKNYQLNRAQQSEMSPPKSRKKSKEDV